MRGSLEGFKEEDSCVMATSASGFGIVLPNRGYATEYEFDFSCFNTLRQDGREYMQKKIEENEVRVSEMCTSKVLFPHSFLRLLHVQDTLASCFISKNEASFDNGEVQAWYGGTEMLNSCSSPLTNGIISISIFRFCGTLYLINWG